MNRWRRGFRSCWVLGLALALGTTGRATAPALTVGLPSPPPGSEGPFPRPVTSWLEAQIALAREGISSGSIDGIPGEQSVAALKAWQEREDLHAYGALDAKTKEQLLLTRPPLVWTILTQEDLNRLQPLGKTWLEKSAQAALEYETALELVAERAHATPALIQRLNPGLDWKQV